MTGHVAANDDAAPPGTAIVRPWRHVKAVRERHAEQLAVRSPSGESRAALTWSWALGENVVAPVTDRVTAVPPSLAEIDAEITEADERRLRADRENHADGAAMARRTGRSPADTRAKPGRACGRLRRCTPFRKSDNGGPEVGDR